MTSVNTQIKNLADIFNLDPRPALAFAKELPPLPEGAEGWFVRPATEALKSNYFPEVNDPDKMHCCGIEIVLSKIQERRELENQFHNRLVRKITTKQLRIHPRTADYLNQIERAQKGDIHIMAAQLGRLYCEETVFVARSSFSGNEFGLDSITVGSIILTNPKRFAGKDVLYLFCAGEESVYLSEFENCPSFDQFSFKSGIGYVRYGSGSIHYKSPYYGAASGFIPKRVKEVKYVKPKRIFVPLPRPMFQPAFI
jgi:hypothetical protein